jgi:hypothetical protein
MELGFTYLPLNAGEVRMLQFLPGNLLSFELVNINLDQAPSYAALSYTWDDGATRKPKEIYVDFMPFSVGENLYKALHGIGRAIRDEDLHLWVDAVCINQNDLVERHSQLRLMSTIYSKAVLVAIWLGDESEDTPKAVEEITNLLKQWVRLARANNVELGADVTSHISPDDPFCLAVASSQAIWNILNRPWFSRTWIAQEVTWTQERKFFCGHFYFTWEQLAAASKVAHKFAPFEETKLDPFEILDTITKWRKDNINTRRYLLNLLGEFRVYDCTDPKDKIYAIAGLASDFRLGYEPGDIIPDYANSVEEVYIDFAATSLLNAPQGHELDFLGHVIRGSPDFEIDVPDTLPSWVPDWRIKRSIYPFYKYQFKFPTDEIHGSNYNASRRTKFKGFINGNHLQVWGLIHSRITYLSPPSLLTETSKPEAYHFQVDLWSQTKQNTIVDKVFLNTMIANTIDASDAMGRTFPTRTNDFDWNTQGTVEAMRKATYGRRLIWTDEGKMGLAPAAAKVGDRIFLFSGGQVLYVMRKRDKCCEGEWEFVGECYVCDMMDGGVLFGETYQRRICSRFVIA